MNRYTQKEYSVQVTINNSYMENISSFTYITFFKCVI